MKSFFTFIFISLFFTQFMYSQKYDYNWVLGTLYDYSKGSNKVELNYKNIIHFNDYSIDHISRVTSKNSKISAYNLTASDSTGNLIFYFNGLRFFNNKNSIMKNGDSIGYNLYRNWWVYDSCCNSLYGDDSEWLNYTQKFIPFPNKKNQYLVFFTYVNKDRVILVGGPFNTLLTYVRIDMDADNGNGAVIEKDSILIDGHMESLGLVRHANGVDWWLVTSAVGSNIFYTYYISSDGITGPKKSVIEPKLKMKKIYIGEVSHFDMFSPDGNIFVKIQNFGGLFLYNFDRCTGEMTFFKKIDVLPSYFNIAFSPDSKYLYVNSGGNLYQIDIYSPENEYQLISLLNFVKLQLAPDNRIYFSSFDSKHVFNSEYLGYINRPNMPGMTCDVRIAPITTPELKNLMLPQYPNYRLKAIENANCEEIDTIFKPLPPKKFTFDNKEYILSSRYRMLTDSTGYNMYKISK